MPENEATQELNVSSMRSARVGGHQYPASLGHQTSGTNRSSTTPSPDTTQGPSPLKGSIPPTFFDGSYFSSPASAAGKVKTSSRRHTRRLFEYSVPKWSLLYTSTLIVLDMVMTLLAAAIIMFVYPEAHAYPFSHAIFRNGMPEYLTLICLSWFVSLALSHIFERHTMGEGYELYSKIYKAACINFILLATISYLLKLDTPRSLTVGIPILTALFTSIERWLMRRALQRNRHQGEYNYPTVIVGSPSGLHRTIALLEEHKGLGYAPIAVCPVAAVREDDDATGPQHLVSAPFAPANDRERALRVLPMNSHLPQTAKYLKANTVLITDVIERYSETMRTLSLAVESMGIELAFSSAVADLDGASLHLRNHPSMPVLTARLPQYSLLTRMLKRLFDIVLSLSAMIIVAIPMALVAIAVKHEDGGPVFYCQQRIGLYGRPFTMYKIRSMRTDADDLKARLAKEQGMETRFIFKMKHDPRVTRIGRFIRHCSLDELPQFFNVFIGNMSLVGPRPPLPDEVERYGTLYSTRLLVKPGITGPWQISGRSDLSQEGAEHLDVSYIQNWSLTGDLAILVKTVGAVIRGTGSY
ncbi:sugar transferase [Bifidobacterium mongoliense]|uniref:sugar transferase n=1 Tax=Bifidobacterium mongoliense TaxID=518643 RepID=UPI0030EB3628